LNLEAGISQYKTRAPCIDSANAMRSGTLNTSHDQVDNTIASRINGHRVLCRNVPW
jgi:hypothetical protein